MLRWGDYGWIFWCSEEHAAVAVELGYFDLAKCMQRAIEDKCKWLRLDCDASTTLSLPTYKWK